MIKYTIKYEDLMAMLMQTICGFTLVNLQF